MSELRIEADVSKLQEVIDFVSGILEAAECPMRIMTRMSIAVEEIFVNIAYYAYTTEKGMAVIRCDVKPDPKMLEIVFIDEGIPYDPLVKEDPDTTLSAEEREVGGLGIFMAKKFMDQMLYERKEGKNILTMRKAF